MILYLKVPKNDTKHFLDLINTFSKVVWYKINILFKSFNRIDYILEIVLWIPYEELTLSGEKCGMLENTQWLRQEVKMAWVEQQ
jgi:hypothetical protein